MQPGLRVQLSEGSCRLNDVELSNVPRLIKWLYLTLHLIIVKLSQAPFRLNVLQ